MNDDLERAVGRVWRTLGCKHMNEPTVEQIALGLHAVLRAHDNERRGQSKALVRKSAEIRELKKRILVLEAALANPPDKAEIDALRAENHRLSELLRFLRAEQPM